MSPIEAPAIAIVSPHTSYIEGKSAPTTPGILGRSSSRRQLGGAGLSRKLSIYDSEYAPVQVNHQGVPRHALRPDPEDRIMPKAKSEAALLSRPSRSALPRLATPLQHPNSATLPTRTHIYTNDDDWMTRAALATSSMVRESKGQSWLTSRHSSTSLNLLHSSDDDEDHNLATMSASSLQRLHFADDEFSPETPRATSRWGSRFGSRVASARNSRRGSRVNLSSPEISHGPSDYFGRTSVEPEQSIRPDFVDPTDQSDEEDPEQEVARLAREASFGFGTIIDRLVGWTLFDVTEDRDNTDVEADDETPPASQSKPTQRASPPRAKQIAASTPRPRNQDEEEESGWQDAAWLLGVASKVLL